MTWAIFIVFQLSVYISMTIGVRRVISAPGEAIVKHRFNINIMPTLRDTDMIEMYHVRSFPRLLVESQAGQFGVQTSGLVLRSTDTSEVIVLLYEPANYSACFLPIVGSNHSLTWDARAQVTYMTELDLSYWQQSTFLGRINGVVYTYYLRWVKKYLQQRPAFVPFSICSSSNSLSCFTFGQTWDRFLEDSLKIFAQYAVQMHAVLPPRASEMQVITFFEPSQFSPVEGGNSSLGADGNAADVGDKKLSDDGYSAMLNADQGNKNSNKDGFWEYPPVEDWLKGPQRSQPTALRRAEEAVGGPNDRLLLNILYRMKTHVGRAIELVQLIASPLVASTFGDRRRTSLRVNAINRYLSTNLTNHTSSDSSSATIEHSEQTSKTFNGEDSNGNVVGGATGFPVSLPTVPPTIYSVSIPGNNSSRPPSPSSTFSPTSSTPSPTSSNSSSSPLSFRNASSTSVNATTTVGVLNLTAANASLSTNTSLSGANITLVLANFTNTTNISMVNETVWIGELPLLPDEPKQLEGNVTPTAVHKYYEDLLSCMQGYQMETFSSALRSCTSEGRLAFLYNSKNGNYFKILPRYPFVYDREYLQVIPAAVYAKDEAPGHIDYVIALAILSMGLIGFLSLLWKLQVFEWCMLQAKQIHRHRFTPSVREESGFARSSELPVHWVDRIRGLNGSSPLTTSKYEAIRSEEAAEGEETGLINDDTSIENCCSSDVVESPLGSNFQLSAITEADQAEYDIVNRVRRESAYKRQGFVHDERSTGSHSSGRSSLTPAPSTGWAENTALPPPAARDVTRDYHSVLNLWSDTDDAGNANWGEVGCEAESPIHGSLVVNGSPDCSVNGVAKSASGLFSAEQPPLREQPLIELTDLASTSPMKVLPKPRPGVASIFDSNPHAYKPISSFQ